MITSILYPTKNNVVAVITSHNFNTSFIDRLSHILNQVDKIVIIDNNSDNSTLVLLKEIEVSSKIFIIYNAINLGVATALNQGVRWAINNLYKWVLLLDQDTFISDSLIEILCSSYQEMKNREQIGIIGPGYSDIKSRKYFIQFMLPVTYFFTEVKSVITSGSLIPIEVYEKIGPFRDDLFIDFVDIEYCLRARTMGYKVMKVHSLLMQHSIGSITMHRLPWKITGTTNHSPFRRYYMMRNNIILAKEYLLFDPGWVLSSLVSRVKSTLLMLLFEKQRILKFKYSVLGIHDGILGNVNRTINQG